MSGTRKKELYTKRRVIPYSVLLQGLKSMLGALAVDQGEKTVFPEKIAVFLSPSDRKAREKVEDVLIEELTRDIIRYMRALLPGIAIEKLQLQIRTDDRLLPSLFRIQSFMGEKILYSREHHDNHIDITNTEMREWDATDIYSDVSEGERSILVVDDEPVLCAILDRMLSRLGFHVVSAHNGIEAMKILDRMSIDLVISDLRMPEMDGWTLMQYSKKKNPDVPFVLITGYHSIHTQQKASKSSADGYLSKPFSLQQIKSILNHVMNKKDDTNTQVTFISQ